MVDTLYRKMNILSSPQSRSDVNDVYAQQCCQRLANKQGEIKFLKKDAREGRVISLRYAVMVSLRPLIMKKLGIFKIDL